MKRLLLLSCLFLPVAQAHAQFAGPRLNSIFDYRDAAADKALTVSTAPPSETIPVHKVDGVRMENAGYSSATDGLSLLPGIFVRRTNAFGRADVDIRGIGDNGRRLAVMVDGRPDKMSLYGCAVTQTLPLNNVERVEVVEGPASALFGSGAMGGAINVVTRGARSPYEGDVRVSYASHNTKEVRIRGGGTVGDNDFYAAGQRQTSDGYTANSSYDANDYTVEYGRKFGEEWKFRLRNKLYSGTEYDPAPVDLQPSATSWFDYRRGATDVSGSFDNGSLKSVGRVFNSYGRHSFSDGWLSEDSTLGTMIKAGLENGDGGKAELGGDYYWMRAKRLGTGAGAWHRFEYGTYAAASSPFGKMFFVDGAIRWTGDKTNAPVWVPSAGLAFKPWNQVEAYATVAKGIRFAQMSELYVFPASNPNLRPETVWGYETGLKLRPQEKVFLRGAAYINEGHDLIEAKAGRFRNTGDFIFRGFQAEAKLKMSEEFSINGNYTFLDPGRHTSGRPMHTATGGVLYDDGGWGFSADCQYAGRYYKGDNYTLPINDIFTVNTRVWHNFDGGLQLFAGINNLLDRRYVIYATNTSYTGLFLMPGITVNGGLQWSFGG